MTNFTTRTVAAGLAAALVAAAAAPGWSAPMMTSTAALKAAIPAATEIQWRPRYGWAIAGAAAAGIVAGAAIASRPYYYGYYARPPVYVVPPPVYYAAPPAYYAAPPAAAYYGAPVYGGYPPAYYSYRNQQDPAGCGVTGRVC